MEAGFLYMECHAQVEFKKYIYIFNLHSYFSMSEEFKDGFRSLIPVKLYYCCNNILLMGCVALKYLPKYFI